MAAAWIDGLRGHDEIQVYGLRRRSAGEFDRLLMSRYGVETNHVAGCVVSPELIRYARGYNSITRSRVNARFARDVFAECAEDAEASVDAVDAATSPR